MAVRGKGLFMESKITPIPSDLFCSAVHIEIEKVADGLMNRIDGHERIFIVAQTGGNRFQRSAFRGPISIQKWLFVNCFALEISDMFAYSEPFCMIGIFD